MILIILFLFNAGHTSRFVKGILDCIQRFLVQKEEVSLPEHVNTWVQREAIEQNHLPDYGTFREALIRCFEDRVTPVLMTIISEMDRNCNLMILQRESKYHNLWLDLFESCVGTTEVANVKLAQSNAEGTFVCNFPFSSHVIQTMEDAVKVHVSQGTVKYHFYLALFKGELRAKLRLWLKMTV